MPPNSRRPRFVRRAVTLAAAAFLAVAVVHAGTGAAGVAAGPPTASSDVTRYYTMTVRLRPFLLWMTWDDVGGARMSWSGSPGSDRRLELLIGSDPERSPRSINRWGFVSERTLGGTSQLTGVMTETDDQSIDAARANGGTAMRDGHVYRAIRATVRDNEVTTTMTRVVVESDLTYRHYAALLDRLPAADGHVQRIHIGPGLEPGFLTAIKRLVHESLDRPRQDGRALHCDFVYTGRLFSLSLRPSAFLEDAIVNGRSHGRAIDAQFEIRNLATGTTTPFRMVYGARGPEAETPFRLVYRPRWWVEIELQVDDDPLNRFAMAGPPPAGPRQ